MSTEEAGSQDALHRRKMRKVEEPVEKGGSPSSSSSDAHDELQSGCHEDTSDHDDHTNEHDDQSNCDDQSAGTMLQRHQLTDNGRSNTTLVVGTAELQKADLIPATVETTEAFSPAPIEVSTKSGGSQPFHIDQDTHLTPQEQHQVPVQSILSPEQSLLPPAMRMQSLLPTSNSPPVDQLARNVWNIHATGANYVNNNTYMNLPTPNLPPELHLPSSLRFPGSQLNPLYSQISGQIGNDIGTRSQWNNSHPQQQINMFEPSIPSRNQDIQVQRLLPFVSLPPNSSIYHSGGSPCLQLPGNPTQPGMGAYNMGPYLPLYMEELPVIGNFNNGLGLGVQGPFPSESHIGMGESSPREPSRHPLVNMTWSDIVHPIRAPQLTNRVPQAQGIQGQAPSNRPIFNSVYDPMYETMGLPIDPHLRMFLASKREMIQESERRHEPKDQ